MPKWTIEEEAVLAYYTSRQIKNATIAQILEKKCPPRVRTEKQVVRKVGRLRTACAKKKIASQGSWYSSDRKCDRSLADEWLFSKMEKAKLEKLLEFDVSCFFVFCFS